MNIGDVVHIRDPKVMIQNEVLSGWLRYKSEKGRVFVFLLLGDDSEENPTLDVEAVLNSWGWEKVTK
jgi:hypothetical protein